MKTEMRLDLFIAQKHPEVSRARVQALIESGHIRVNGRQVKTSYKYHGDERIDIDIPEPKASHLTAEDMPLDVLYEDRDIVVINKPAGLVVHPGAGHREGTLVNALLHHFPDMHVGDTERPGLVHRLDKETSGVMVCARNDRAFQALVRSFKAREVEKSYRAFCVGIFKDETFELKTGHNRHPKDRKRFTTKISHFQKGGLREISDLRLAHSQFTVLLSSGGITELQVNLLTGRTHQIRAHLADIGRPLVHDTLYGGTRALEYLKATPVRASAMLLERHALHAERLAFIHPTNGQPVVFTAPLPEDLLQLHHALAAC